MEGYGEHTTTAGDTHDFLVLNSEFMPWLGAAAKPIPGISFTPLSLLAFHLSAPTVPKHMERL